MRLSLLLVLLAVGTSTGGCSSWPGFADPRIDLGGVVAFYRLRGRARMQSAGAGGAQNNPAIALRDFALGERDDDVGASLSVGDGFSGFDVQYLKLTMRDTSTGTLTAPFGPLPQGESVFTVFEGDEIRGRYIAELLPLPLGDELKLSLGGGGVLAHRGLKFFPRSVATNSGPLLDIKDDGVAYVAARGRLSRGPVAAVLDWAYSPDLTFGGDFDGTLQDIELSLRYTAELQNVELFVGWRYSDLPVAGVAQGLDYAAKFRMDGYFVGGAFRF